jgi:hypothetical protein
VPEKFPAEFKRDVVRVARRGDLSHAEVAADFDVSVESVRRPAPIRSPTSIWTTPSVEYLAPG